MTDTYSDSLAAGQLIITPRDAVFGGTMTPIRISRLRTGSIAVLIGDGSFSAALWVTYLLADDNKLTLLGSATTTSVLAGIAALAAMILTGQAAIVASARRERNQAAYWRGYGDCAAHRLPDPPETRTHE